MSVTSVPSLSFPQANRRRAVLLLVVALALVRSTSLPSVTHVNDAVTLKSWRENRRQTREARKRRERETPLYGHS